MTNKEDTKEDISPPKNTECIFCKIIKGEIPAYKIVETENVLAFLDINPASLGHTLVIPKKHYMKITEMPQKELFELFAVVQSLAKLYEEKFSTDYNIVINQGPKAGQIVPHVHVHIIPRYGNEKIIFWDSHRLTPEEVQEIYKRLKNQ